MMTREERGQPNWGQWVPYHGTRPLGVRLAALVIKVTKRNEITYELSSSVVYEARV